MLIRLLGDVLSPPRCAACDVAVQQRHVFCVACAATVERCGADAIAPVRAAPSGHAPVEVAYGFYGGALATAIRRLKYEDRPYLARPLGELVRTACRAEAIAADAVVPVPLHPKRLAERGYNQAALLAGHVARELGAPLVTTALSRVVDTVPQVTLSSAERRINLASAMRVSSRSAIAGQKLALVDDVSTTGATFEACRQALLEAGARRVTGVFVARTITGAPEVPIRGETFRSGLTWAPYWT